MNERSDNNFEKQIVDNVVVLFIFLLCLLDLLLILLLLLKIGQVGIWWRVSNFSADY